jgi:type III pantothenate kinase
MLLLLDIGNTHTHVGLASNARVLRQRNIPTRGWFDASMEARITAFARLDRVQGVGFCSVVPRATERCLAWLWSKKFPFIELTSETLRCVGIDYPNPRTIGPDRLANAAAVCVIYGGPSVVVDFGTAVTFDVVDKRRNYIGGIIAPGLSAMTDYLHEKTALLPKIKVREPRAIVGKNTREAMLVGAVHGYRGLVRALIAELKRELKSRRLPVIATGGCARLIAKGLPEITKVEPNLTLEGIRLVWLAHNGEVSRI